MGRAIEGYYRSRGRDLGVHDGRAGSLTVVQRFGSDLALNLHFHMLCPDGVFDAHGHFTPVPAPSREQMQTLCARIASRTFRLLERRALSEPDERALAASLARSAARRGARAHGPQGADPESEGDSWRRKARIDGFDLDATTEVRAHDRERLEHLGRYLLRPPLADRRLRILPTGEVALELKTPWKDGTAWLTMSADTLLERLASPRGPAPTRCSSVACSLPTPRGAPPWCLSATTTTSGAGPRTPPSASS